MLSLEKVGDFVDFVNFTGKYLCSSHFYNNIANLACNLIIKETPTEVYFAKFFKNVYFVEHEIPRETATTRKFFCHQIRAISNLFRAHWLKCTQRNNVCFNRISISEKCRQKKKLLPKMHMSVFLLETKNVYD